MKITQFRFEHLSLILVLLITLASCSTTSTDTSYYLLNANQNSATKNSTNGANIETTKEKKLVILQLEELPEYLSQRYLVMQLDDHRLHYAQFHIWAEPLYDGIEKALISDLNSANIEFQFVTDSDQISNETQAKLHVHIDHFFANNQSSVTLSGKYWLDGQAKNGTKRFHYTKALEKNGYPHSVAQMRSLLKLLSNDVLSNEL